MTKNGLVQFLTVLYNSIDMNKYLYLNVFICEAFICHTYRVIKYIYNQHMNNFDTFNHARLIR
jgi:hypothetical protein